ncbi:MAG: AAA family ATPase [Acidimicrobiia bacterium]
MEGLRQGLGLYAVLVADMSDSTRRRVELGDEQADELAAWFLSTLVRVTETTGGTLVQTLGDGVFAAFSVASDAIAAAVHMQRAIKRRRRFQDVVVRIRCGVSVGEVSVDGDSLRGMAVIEAFRLCDVASADQIIVSALVRQVAQHRIDVPVIDLGPLVLKGIAEPVLAFDVNWEASVVTDAAPLPPALAAVDPLSIVGREEEQRVLAEMWDRARSSGRSLTLIAGEPGAGKTRLARELARGVHRDGALVLYGRCDEAVAYPFEPFVEALRFFLGAGDHRELVTELGEHARLLARAVPELSSVLGVPLDVASGVHDESAARVFAAWARLFAIASSEVPTLVVLDDLQWATAPTLQLFRSLVESEDTMRVLFVATYRSTELNPHLESLLADLRRSVPDSVRLDLRGIDVDSAAALVRSADASTSPELADRLARTIVEQSKGNPLFVTELIRHAVTSGGEPARLPGSLRELVRGRLARLDERAVDLLVAGSVFGDEFHAREVASMTARAVPDVIAPLSAAVRAGLLDEQGDGLKYRFTHALLRTVLYDDLTVSERVRGHFDAALALERSSSAKIDRAAELAYHFYESRALGGGERAFHWAMRAGTHAAELQAHDEARAWFQQALDLHEDYGGADNERVDVLLELGRAQLRSGDPEAFATLRRSADLAYELGDNLAVAHAALAANRGFFSSTGLVDHEQVAVLERALECAGTSDTEQRAALLALLASELVWGDDHERRFALSDDAVAMAARLGDIATMIRALQLRLVAIDAADTLPERARTAERLLDLVSGTGNDELAFQALFYAWRVRIEAGQAAGQRAVAEQLLGTAERTRQPAFRWLATTTRACSAILEGRLAEADRYVHDALRYGKQAGRDDEAWIVFGEQFFEICRLRGHLSETMAVARGIEKIPNGLHALVFGYLVDGGAVDDARAHYLSEMANGLPVRRGPGELALLNSYAYCASRLSELDRAEELYERLLPHADQHALSTIIWPASGYYLGLLADAMGRRDQAIVHLRRACAVHERIGAPLLLARSRIALGALVDEPESTHLLTAAYDDAFACGAHGLAAMAESTTRSLPTRQSSSPLA